MKHVNIYIEVLFQGRPQNGIGKYIALLEYVRPDGNNPTKGICVSMSGTTRNRAALQAVNDALGCIREPCEVDIYTDNMYLYNAVQDRSYIKWQQDGWRHGSREIRNADIWERFAGLACSHQLTARNRQHAYSGYLKMMIQRYKYFNEREDAQDARREGGQDAQTSYRIQEPGRA